MKLLKRGLAVFLAAMIISSNIPMLHATEEPTENEITQVTLETSDTTETAGDVEASDTTEVADDVETSDTTEVADDVETSDTTKATDDVEMAGTTEAAGNVEASDTTETTGDVGASDDVDTDDATEAADDVETDGTTETVDDVDVSDATEITDDVETDDTTETADDIEAADAAETEDDAEETDITEELETEQLISFEEIEDVVAYNTGKVEINVIPSDVYSEELSDVCLEDNIIIASFDDDGSFTIEVEPDAFFPYEVQFKYDGVTENKWFISPNDSVKVNGHTFYIRSEFSGNVITQFKLRAAGRTVTVYPEEKEFTNEGGTSTYSLMPLEEKSLFVDLSGLNPLQLTRVAVRSAFAGTDLVNADKIVWKVTYSDGYKIISQGDKINLNYDSESGGTTWEMIAGDGEQLNLSNIRYQVRIKTDSSRDWLKPAVYKQNSDGSFTGNVAESAEYSTSYGNDKSDSYGYEYIYLSDGINSDDVLYLNINKSVFGSDNVKVYEGRLSSPDAIDQAKEITGEILGNPGYRLQGTYANITVVSVDGSGNVSGFLPMYIKINAQSEYLSFSLRDISGNYCSYSYSSYSKDNCEFKTYELYSGFSADAQYSLSVSYYKNGSYDSEINGRVIAYKGLFNSLAEAQSSGAENVTSAIMSYDGYIGNYSQGVDFTFFVSDKVLRYNIKVETGVKELSGGTELYIYGFNDADGNSVTAHVIDKQHDSYAEHRYLTVLVDQAVDLTNLALVFSASDGAKVYCKGSKLPEESGKKCRDFSKGAVQYSVVAENEENPANYWVQVLKQDESSAKLYINSLIDPNAKTEVIDGITYTEREVMIDGLHNYVHDILIANMGNNDISKISVELDSDAVVLDPYWTLNGNQNLGTFKRDEINDDKLYGELSNLAKIRLIRKYGVSDGTDVTGTLTFKENGNTILVMNLTGTVGNPTITTTEIPETVKYVPYGTMIQNSNKYSTNNVNYSLLSGELPSGMELKKTGEIYGVPKEAGTFHIRVRMDNSISSFGSSYRDYDLIVLDNTDENVDNFTDGDYMLSTRLIPYGADYLVVSEGVFTDFKYVYIDGEKLVKGVDYDAESGSTRITIRSEALLNKGAGVHTLGIEFREGGEETGILKRAAQNYDTEKINEAEKPSDSNGSGSNSNNSSTNNGSSDNSSTNNSSSDNSSTSDSSSSNNNAASRYEAIEQVVNEANFVYREGYKIAQFDLSYTELLRASLMNKYRGQKMYMNAALGAFFGLTIDMAEIPVIKKDYKISYSILPGPVLSPEFDTIHCIPKTMYSLEFNAVLNFHIGAIYTGHEAYIFQLNEASTGYELVSEMAVNEIGNIAFASNRVTDIMILVKK